MNYKKCIVLDLDNTLWGGIIGEDGFDNIKLSPLTREGSAFIAFQQGLLDLYNRGVILAINSRNNADDALSVIQNHPNMILKEHHFAAIRINWKDKAENIIDIAKELNIGLDSLVFLDDDPTNRSLVREIVSEVDVPDLPINPESYAKFLLSLPYFPVDALTDEDKMRGSLYVTERLRQQAEKTFLDKIDFYTHLGLELTLFVDDPLSLPRLSQMTEKTNQFNSHKIPINEEQMSHLVKDSNYLVIHGQVLDRFGSHGITNLAIINKRENEWCIEQFVMSCRVIGRGIEEAFLSRIIEMARENNISKLKIEFVSTEKNIPARDFIEKNFTNFSIDVNKIIDSPSWVSIHYGKI